MLITAKSVHSLTQDDVDLVVHGIPLGIKLLKEIDSDSPSSRKLLRLLTDIQNVFTDSQTAIRADAGPETISPQFPCSQCSSLLPNYPAYLTCLENCTP